MLPRLPKGAGPAPARRKAVRDAVLAAEFYRMRALRVIRHALRQAPAGSPEAAAWSALLERMRRDTPWQA